MSGETTRTLVLLRHAKSDYPVGVPDHDRPLSARGRRDAPVAGRWLRDHTPMPDLAVVSTATRTRQTWALAAEQMAFDGPSRFVDDVYEASVPDLLTVVASVPAEVGTLLVVGHNPGTQDLAAHLVSGGDPAARTAMASKYPTSGIAVLTTTSAWDALAPGCATLAAFVVPRG